MPTILHEYSIKVLGSLEYFFIKNCQSWSNNHFYKMATHQRQPTLTQPKPISIQWFFYKVTTSLTWPEITFFRWGTHLYMSLFPSVCPSVHPSICHAPYLRNRTSSNHNFWDTYVKWWYLQSLFLFFQNFDFLGC